MHALCGHISLQSCLERPLLLSPADHSIYREMFVTGHAKGFWGQHQEQFSTCISCAVAAHIHEQLQHVSKVFNRKQITAVCQARSCSPCPEILQIQYPCVLSMYWVLARMSACAAPSIITRASICGCIFRAYATPGIVMTRASICECSLSQQTIKGINFGMPAG